MSYELELSVGTQDMDYDRIPDWWEYQNGLSITNQTDAFADFDGDWIDNLWEYKLGYDPHVYNTNNYAFAEATRAVDTRIAGKTPTNAIKIYSTQNHSAGIYERNTNCWAADIDLTSCSPWNSYTIYPFQRAGTLISPRHAVFVNHIFANLSFWVPPGNTLRFVDATNGIYTATIESVHHLNTANADLTVATLTADVPTSRFGFAKVLPDNFTNYLGRTDIHVPGLCLDQEEKAIVNDLEFIKIGPGVARGDCYFNLSIYGARTNFCDGNPVPGDSGNPGFIIINGEPVLLTLMVFPIGGGAGTPVSTFKNEINAIMSQSGNYSLTEIDLSDYDEIPVGLR
jgi:hypothetical protein